MSAPAPFAPVDPTGIVLGDEVYTLLGDAILDGRLAAGERLRDVELAGRLGVSRTPVREALQRLEWVGLVEVSAHRYTRVSPHSEKVLRDTHEFTALLLGNAVNIAVGRCTDEELADAGAIVDDIITASIADDHAEIMAASTLLFERMILATGNNTFLRVLQEGKTVLRRNLEGWHPSIECPVARTDAYRAFRAAVLERDGAQAEAILRELHGLR